MWDRLPHHLRLCRHRFLASDSRILASHERCRNAGMDSESSTLQDILSGDEIGKLLHEQRARIAHACEVFTEVHQLLRDRSALFILTDRRLRVLEIYSAPEVICRCADLGLRPGASLTESSCGTNAVAMAAHLREPSIIQGTQHYCRMFHDWSCAAVPIIDQHGEFSGCVDISLGATGDLGEALALASLLADKLAENVRSSLTPALGTHTPEIGRIVNGHRPRPISTTQMLILAALRNGMTCKQIAVQLDMSARTVESHLEKLRKKFNAKTTIHLMAMIVEEQRSTPGGVDGPPCRRSA